MMVVCLFVKIDSLMREKHQNMFVCYLSSAGSQCPPRPPNSWAGAGAAGAVRAAGPGGRGEGGAWARRLAYSGTPKILNPVCLKEVFHFPCRFFHVFYILK